jgi:type I restriction enzyme S subunit
LYSSQLALLNLNLPSLPEQQKIASFLTAVDDKINQLSKKAELLEQYKKGVIQKIFKQEIRFKPTSAKATAGRDNGGNDYPDWEERKLGEVIEFFNTNSYSRSLLNYNNGSVKNIHYGDIHTKFKSNFDITQENVPYINENVDLSKIKSEQYCQIGDLIIADASEDYKDIGKAIEIVNLNDEKVVAGLHTYIARDKEQVAIGFKGYLFRSEYIRKQIMKLATGVSVLGISKGNLASMSIFIPCLEEQQKIASFLTSIDRKIEQVNTQLEKAKIWKKGLLQKMFV